MTEAAWIKTSTALGILEWEMSARTFRDTYRDIFQFTLTKGGHYMWLRVEIEDTARLSKSRGA
jgi:hypothetical protein